MSGTFHLATRLGKHRARRTLSLLFLAVVLAGLGATFATVAESGERAILDSVSHSNGGRAYSIQVINGEDAGSRLRAAPGNEPVLERSSTVSTSRAAAPVRLRDYTTPQLEFGPLQAGRMPQRAGEAAITPDVATALQVEPGSTVLVPDSPRGLVRIVGIYYDPADRRAVGMLRMVSDLSSASYWLTNSDPYSNPRLRDLFDRRSLTFRTTARLASDEVELNSGPLSRLAIAPTIMALFMGGVLIVAQVADRQTWTRDINALTASGMKAASAVRLCFVAWFAPVVLGAAFGLVIGPAMTTAFQDPISGSLGQEWESIAIPVPILLPTFVAIAAATVVMLAAQRLTSTALRLPRFATRGVVAVCTALFAAGVCILGASSLQILPASSASLGGLLTAAGTPGVLIWLASRGLGPTVKLVYNHLAAPALLLILGLSVLVWSTVYYSARTAHAVNVSSSLSAEPQPLGSLLALEVPDETAIIIVDQYRKSGGKDVQMFQMVDEARRQVRVAAPKTLLCMEETQAQNPNQLPGRCYAQDASSPVNTAFLGARGAGNFADPNLVEDGSVGVLSLPTDARGRSDRQFLTKAAPRRGLGGNMPGLVIDPTTATAKKLGIRPSGSALVAMIDFSDLPPERQAQMRATVTRLAPSAQVAESTTTRSDERRSLARVVGVGGGVLSAILLVVIGWALLNADTVDRGNVSELFPTRRRWGSFTLRWGLPFAGVLMLSSLAGLWSAWIYSTHLPGGFGLAWTTPFFFGVLALTVLLRSFYLTRAWGESTDLPVGQPAPPASRP